MATMAPWRRCAPARGGTPLAGVLVRTTVSHSRPDRGTRGTAWAPSRRWGGAVAESAPGAAAPERGRWDQRRGTPARTTPDGVCWVEVPPGRRHRSSRTRTPRGHTDDGGDGVAGHEGALLKGQRRGRTAVEVAEHGRSCCVRRPTSWSLASKTRNASRATATSRITKSASPRGRCVSGPARCGSSRRSSSGANSASRPGRAAWTTRSRS